jgi:hypothetical protein
MTHESMKHETQVAQIPITSPKLAVWITIGVVFWFIAAMMVRIMGTAVFTTQGSSMVILFALSFPFGFGALRLIGWMVGLRGIAFLPALVVMTMTAVFLDAIAFTWTGLYGLPAESSVYGAAWILWGVGCISLFALLDSRAQSSLERA